MLSLALALPCLAQSPDYDPDRTIDMLRAAVRSCSAQGYSVVAVFAGADGVARIQYADPSAAPINVEAARRKALTAILLHAPTLQAEELARKAAGYAATVRELDSRVLLVGGGVPITANGRVIGAVGVAGAPGGQFDDNCARKAMGR